MQTLTRKLIFVLALAISFIIIALPLYTATRAAEQTVSPTAVKPNGKIAYSKQNIYTINSDGTGETNVTKVSATERYPAWSPDGTKIAFCRLILQDNAYDIFVINADGSNEVRLAANSKNDVHPTWSPDGTKIAFATNRDGNDEIYVMNADGTNLVNLTNNPAYDLDPVWSPDGSKIAFVSTRAFSNPVGNIADFFEIYVMNADGSNPIRLTNNSTTDGSPTWSPDSAKIAFNTSRDGNSEIYSMNADGSNQVNLTNHPSFDFNPAWSPDGTKIAFCTYRDDNRTIEIYYMEANGSFPIRVTNNTLDDREPSWGPVSSGPTPTPTPTPSPTPTPTPTPRYTISGRVTDASGSGLSDVTMILAGDQTGSQTVTTQANGNYLFYYTPDTRLKVTPVKTGYRFSPQAISFVSSRSVTGDQTANFTATPATISSSLQFSLSNYSVSESTSSATITVTRTGDISGGATVNYRTIDDLSPVRCDTANGTAYARCDYATTLDTLLFSAGDTQKTFTIPLVDDAHVEGSETFSIALSNPIGATLGSQSTATVTITDNDTTTSANPIYSSPFFVRQQYLDFLNREPESSGFSAWVGVLNRCPDVNNDPTCDRITVSASFFQSEEFQLKGYYVYRFYKVSLGRLPTYAEIIPDMRSVTGTSSEEVFAKRTAFANAWLTRPEFQNLYGGLSDSEYVDKLLQTEQVTLTGNVTRNSLVQDLQSGRRNRADVLRAIVEHPDVGRKEYNGAFVAIQYFGYLRRDPEADGYNAWLRVINRGEGFRVMVDGFMNSPEYRLRFGQP